jgi:hypothetical protein
LAHELAHVVQQSSVSSRAETAGRVQRACPKAPTGIGKAGGWEPATCAKEGPEGVAGSSLRFCQDSAQLIDGQEAVLANTVAEAKDVEHVDIHGYASTEGPKDDPVDYNYRLSCWRANEIEGRFRVAGIANTRRFKHGPTTAFSAGEPEFNRTVIVQLGPKRARSISTIEWALLNRLSRLGVYAAKEGAEGAEFRKVVADFRAELARRMSALKVDDPLPDDVSLVMKALLLWSKDPGIQWGEGSWDSSDLVMSAPDYATVPASQNKCNAYVAEVAYRSFGVVHKAIEQREYVSVWEGERATGKYFTYRARQWGDAGVPIPKFTVVTAPQMGDIWSNGTHTGIYLGSYEGKLLYISARDDGDGVFGLKAEIQREHGIQIKYLPAGGVYRRYTP